MKIIVLLFLTLSLIACDSHKGMRDNFGDGKHLFIEQSTGDYYIISHRFGDNYSISPLSSKKVN